MKPMPDAQGYGFGVLAQQRRIGCHFYHIAVALHIAEVDALSQRIVEILCELEQL